MSADHREPPKFLVSNDALDISCNWSKTGTDYEFPLRRAYRAPFGLMLAENVGKAPDDPTAIWAKVIFEDGQVLRISPTGHVWRETESGMKPIGTLDVEKANQTRIGDALPFTHFSDQPRHEYLIKSITFCTGRPFLEQPETQAS